MGQSALGLSVGYAKLDGRITDEDSATEERGDTRGFSYSITWSGPFRSTLSYLVGIRVRQYEFEAEQSGDVTEKTVSSLYASISF